MKTKFVIFSIMVLQVNSSFLNEFRGAMSSVENAFGKLMNDVVTDVKSTVHCTILAMERALATRGIVAEPAAFDNECDVYLDSTHPNTYNSIYDLKPGIEADNRYINSADIAQQISSSISRVNDSLNNILDHNGHERLHVNGVSEKETNRLKEVGHLLRQELVKISHKMRKEFRSIEFTSDESSIESIWNDMKTLHDIERNQNNFEAKEIGQVLNEALSVLHINKTNAASDEDKIKVIMQELQHETSNSSVTFANISRELSQWEEGEEDEQSQVFSGRKIIPEAIPKTLTEIATKVFEDKPNIQNKVVDHTLSGRKIIPEAISESLTDIATKVFEDKPNIPNKSVGQTFSDQKIIPQAIPKPLAEVTTKDFEDKPNIQNKVVDHTLTGHKMIPEAIPKTLTDIATKVFEDKPNIPNEVVDQTFSDQKIIPEAIPKTLAEIATKVFEDKLNIQNKIVDHTPEPANVVTNEKEKDTGKRNQVINSTYSEHNESVFSDSISDLGKTIDEANDIIQSSAQAQKMLDSIFGKTDGAASAFDNPEFNFK